MSKQTSCCWWLCFFFPVYIFMNMLNIAPVALCATSCSVYLLKWRKHSISNWCVVGTFSENNSGEIMSSQQMSQSWFVHNSTHIYCCSLGGQIYDIVSKKDIRFWASIVWGSSLKQSGVTLKPVTHGRIILTWPDEKVKIQAMGAKCTWILKTVS